MKIMGFYSVIVLIFLNAPNEDERGANVDEIFARDLVIDILRTV